MAETKMQKIARLNDVLRTTGSGGEVYMTSGIRALGDQKVLFEIQRLVAEFKDFTKENDPYEEHDFGAFSYDDQTINWKIDYYALDTLHGSEDPSDESQTRRILTIMLASER